MKKSWITILFLFLFSQALNSEPMMPMEDIPMVDQEVYTKQISIPETPQKVKDATLSKEEVLQILKNSSREKPAYLWRKNLRNLDFSKSSVTTSIKSLTSCFFTFSSFNFKYFFNR